MRPPSTRSHPPCPTRPSTRTRRTSRSCSRPSTRVTSPRSTGVVGPTTSGRAGRQGTGGLPGRRRRAARRLPRPPLHARRASSPSATAWPCAGTGPGRTAAPSGASADGQGGHEPGHRDLPVEDDKIVAAGARDRPPRDSCSRSAPCPRTSASAPPVGGAVARKIRCRAVDGCVDLSGRSSLLQGRRTTSTPPRRPGDHP